MICFNNIAMKIFVLIALLCVLSLQFSIPNLKHFGESSIEQNLGQPKTVPYVNITRYMGKWYQQAVIPYYFERNCVKTLVNYSLNADGKSVHVYGSCERSGKLVQNTGKAIPEDSTNSKLKVQFIQTLDIGGQYWIVRLDDAYTYAVISSPNYNYLWVIYRQPHMPDDLYNSIIADLRKDGFPVQKLRRTPQ